MDEGKIEHGPRAGQSYKLVGEKYKAQVAADRRHVTVNAPLGIVKQYVGSAQNPIERICTWSDGEFRIE